MHWVGDGFPVRSLFSYDEGAAISPFLLLDHAAEHHFEPAAHPRGVGPHPHRGFETVTIVCAGEVAHRDSAGHGGTIGPGDVQWMTAAGGVVHEEFHSEAFTARGGPMEMVQLWVNLPARAKMAAPRYQDLRDPTMPRVVLPNGGGTVRVIAGSFAGARGTARTVTLVELWDVSLARDGEFAIELPPGHTKMLLVRRGDVVLDGEHAMRANQLAQWPRGTPRATVRAGAGGAELLSVGDVEGDPHDEIMISFSSQAEVWRTSPNVQMLRSLAVPYTQVRALGVGNVDGDAHLEALVGTGSRVYACSPLTGQVVRSYALTGQSGLFAVVGNLDTDGYDDLALGDAVTRLGLTPDPSLVFVSGATGALLSNWSITSQFRAQVLAGVGDVDGDGYGDLLLGDEDASPAGHGNGNEGGWQLVSGKTLGAVVVMPTWCTGGPFAPQLGMTRPVLGQNLTVVGIDCPAGSIGAVGLGPRPDIPFNLGVPGCNAWVDPSNWSVLHVPAPGQTWSYSLALPLTPQLAGLQVALQAFYLTTNSPIGIDLTNGLWARVGLIRATFAAVTPRASANGGERAGAISGAAVGSPIATSTRSIDTGSWIAASSRRRPAQCGHTSTSTSHTRRSSSAHG